MDRLNYIIGELRRILAETDSSSQGDARGGSPAPAPSPGDWIKGKVTFWKVEQLEGARGPYTKATIGIQGREGFMSTFDEAVIMKVDPLTKGDLVEFQTKPSKCGKYVNIAALRAV